MVDWKRIFENMFIKKSGEHGLIGGPTGTGKTQVLYHIAAGISKLHKKETIVWFDIGKSGEPLRLADFRPITFFVPFEKELDIDYTSPEMEQKYKDRMEVEHYQDGNYYDLIYRFKKNRINVIEIKPYIREPDEYAIRVSSFFKALINTALDRKLKHVAPLAIFVDEMHWVAPGQGHALNDEHNDAGKWMQLNIDTLRSMQVRIVGATQNWTKIRRGVRQAFGWIFIKRGLAFTKTDEWRLSRYNGTFERIPTEKTIIALPERNYSDLLAFPFYGDGREIGEINYIMNQEDISPSMEPSPDILAAQVSQH